MIASMTFGWISMAFQWAEVDIVIIDNDKKSHSKKVTDVWEKFGINVCPGAGQVKDWTCIADFTSECEEKIGGFPVNPINSSHCMVQYQNVNNTWKNLVGGLFDTFNKRKPSRKNILSWDFTIWFYIDINYGGFYNGINSFFKNLSRHWYSTVSHGSDYCRKRWAYFLHE